MSDALERAITVCQGASALASAIGASAQRLSNWKARGVPAEMCPLIERETRKRGQPVLCEELRPDVDWGVLRLQAGQSEQQAA